MKWISPSPKTPFGAISACLAVAIAGCGNSAADSGSGDDAVMSSTGSPAGGSVAGPSSMTSPAGTTTPANVPAAGGNTAGGSTGPTGAGATGDVGGNTGAGGAGGAGGAPGTGAPPVMVAPGGTSDVGAGGSMGTGGDGGADAGAGGGLGAGGSPGSGGAGAGGTESAGGSSGSGSGGAGGASNVPSPCPEATPLTGGMEYCSNGKGNAGGGYGYELWADGGGTGCMTVHGVDATFSATWSNVEDFLARVGLDFDQTRTHQQIGTITADFAETKTDDGGLTYIGIYGWTVNPLREFYILDDWGMEKPGGFSSDGTPRDEVGTLTADGETYDVWKKTRENKPAITGDSETFDQYFSIRRTARQCGTISVSEHFNQWEELGLPLGNLHEVKLLLESQFNSGSIQFTTATVIVE